MNLKFVIGLIISIVLVGCTVAGVVTFAVLMMMPDSQEEEPTEGS